MTMEEIKKRLTEIAAEIEQLGDAITEERLTALEKEARELLDKRALPVDLLFTREGPPRLTLVTCGGPFLPDIGGYRDNVVVVAEPAPVGSSSSPPPKSMSPPSSPPKSMSPPSSPSE